MAIQGSECIKPFANDEGVIDKAFRLFYVSTMSSSAGWFWKEKIDLIKFSVSIL
jgi:hypothetical protein